MVSTRDENMSSNWNDALAEMAREPQPVGRMTSKDQILRSKYGMSLVDWMRMYDEQNGRCAICKEEEKPTRTGIERDLCVDHCHASGTVRGLLCRNCNAAIGLLRDDPLLAEAAFEYLRKHWACGKTVTHGDCG